MLQALALILVCQLVGETFVRAIGLPLPGPVIGMALLFLLLYVREKLQPIFKKFLHRALMDSSVETTAKNILSHLSLLFVPAGVGVFGRLDILASYGMPVIFALFVSTVLSLVTAAFVFTVLAQKFAKSAQPNAKTTPEAGL